LSINNRSYHKTALIIVLVAISYAVTGRLGLYWAIESGYASAIWPPSGIALAAMLLTGYSIWPGVFLGSFLANLDPSSLSEAENLQHTLSLLLIWSGIAAGAAMQAVGSTYLLKRFAKFPNNLTSWRELSLFFTFSGPVGCLINCTIGTSSLVIGGIITTTVWPTAWGTWWLGDTLGALIFTPLILVWGLRPKEQWRERRKAVTIFLAGSFALAVVVFNLGQHIDRQDIQTKFIERTDSFYQDLQSQLEKQIHLLSHIDGLYHVSKSVTLQKYREFIWPILNKNTSIRALSWNRRFLHKEREEMEHYIKLNYGQYAKITERAADGTLQPAAKRSEYVTVTYIERLENNIEALGFDVLSNPISKEALDRARDEGRPIATGKISLVQDKDRQNAILIFYPNYSQDRVPIDLQARRKQIYGYQTAIIGVEDMVNQIFAKQLPEGVVVRIFDLTAKPDQQLLYATSLHCKHDENTNYPHSHDNDVASHQQKLSPFPDNSIIKRYNIPLAGRQWELQVAALAPYIDKNRAGHAVIIFIAGLLISSMVGILSLMVTGLKREELERSVAIRTASLEQASQAKSNFLASMSHEIRTPLNTILGMGELLTESELGEDQHKCVHALNQSGIALRTLINDILDISKIEASQLSLESYDFDLHQLLSNTVDIFSFAAAEKGVLLYHSIAEDVAQHVRGDSNRLQQVLINIIGNAIKFTHQGEISLKVEGSHHKDRVSFTISDTGDGIPKDKVNAIFQSFVQADESTTRKYGGTGLGLAICQKLTTMMGGEIQLKSKIGEGSTFTLSIPLPESEANDNIPATKEGSSQDSTEPLLSNHGLNILLVDDSEDNLFLISKFLEKTSHQLTMASDGAEALDNFTKGSFDLVIMDIEMPIMNGFEATQKIRQWEIDNQREKTPIIILTAHALSEKLDQVKEVGADLTLTKPINKNQLLITLGKFSSKKAN
jgi:two-component system, sensor histidine kinase